MKLPRSATQLLTSCFGLFISTSAPASEWSLTGALGAHDPTIIRESDLWWCFSTGAGLPVKFSGDGLAWTQGVRLFESEKSWWRTWAPNMGNLDVWAPDLHFFNGRYWCYYSVSEFGQNNSAIGLTSCTSILAGDWRDDGFVIGSKSGVNPYNAIDPNLTIDASGQPWLVFGSWFDGIQIVPLDPSTMKPDGEVQAIARRPNGIEGPVIVYAKGYYHLFMSIDLCCRGANSTYKIVYGRATNIDGPYEDKDGIPLLAGGGTLLEATAGRWIGPGGQDVHREGNDWVIARHAYDANAGGAPTLRVADLYWDADKWPTFTAPPDLPVITSHPVSLTQPAGTLAELAVTASGTGLVYAWFKDGVPLVGSTGNTLNFPLLQPADAGDYTAQVTTPDGSVMSRFARIVVAPPVFGHIVSMSVRSTAGIAGIPLIVGVSMQGGNKDLLVRAIGPGLTRFDVGGVMTDPWLEMHGKVNGVDTIFGANDNWGDNGLAPALAAEFQRLGAFSLPDMASADAALLTSVSGLRTVLVNSVTPGTSGIVLVEAYDAGGGEPARLISISARNFAGQGFETLIAGFTISGNAPKRVLIRGVGPTLADFDVPNVLGDPRLEVHTKINNVDYTIATNDDWVDEPGVAAMSAISGAFRLRDESTDAAVVVTLPAGLYTALVSGVNTSTDEALVEVYELP